MVNYHDGHIRSRRASIGYLIDPGRQREGIASEAVSAVLGHCFGTLGMHRLEAYIDPRNAASRGLAEKLGFRCEGVLREHLRVGEEWRDDMLYALLGRERGA
jgi:ribosomal-protein-alanine N-acetyltransferase